MEPQSEDGRFSYEWSISYCPIGFDVKEKSESYVRRIDCKIQTHGDNSFVFLMSKRPSTSQTYENELSDF